MYRREPVRNPPGSNIYTRKTNQRNSNLDSHDTNVAILSICGGIAGAITKCEGNPTSTVGQSGTSKFTLNPVNEGATLNVSKGRWERCVKAAKLTCPNGSFDSTCVGGTSDGDFTFRLEGA
jgi:hypothetical protein